MLAHSPRSVVSVWPTRAVPVIAGSRVIAGATAGCTTADGAENAGALAPSPLVAMTRSRSVFPASSAAMSRDVPVSPGMFTQEAPAALQRCHW